MPPHAQVVPQVSQSAHRYTGNALMRTSLPCPSSQLPDLSLQHAFLLTVSTYLYQQCLIPIADCSLPVSAHSSCVSASTACHFCCWLHPAHSCSQEVCICIDSMLFSLLIIPCAFLLTESTFLHWAHVITIADCPLHVSATVHVYLHWDCVISVTDCPMCISATDREYLHWQCHFRCWSSPVCFCSQKVCTIVSLTQEDNCCLLYSNSLEGLLSVSNQSSFSVLGPMHAPHEFSTKTHMDCSLWLSWTGSGAQLVVQFELDTMQFFICLMVCTSLWLTLCTCTNTFHTPECYFWECACVCPASIIECSHLCSASPSQLCWLQIFGIHNYVYTFLSICSKYYFISCWFYCMSLVLVQK